MQKIQAVFSGFSNKPATVFALYDAENDHLYINKEAPFRTDRFGDCLIISNVDLPERETLFELDMINDAINYFFEMTNSDRLEIQDAAVRCSPNNKIERDGINENGKFIYRIDTDISNGQVAVLAIAWHVKQAKVVSNMLDFQEKLFDLSSGEIYSI